MSKKPLAMEQIKQIMRLYLANVSLRRIAEMTGVSRNTIRKYVRRLNVQEATPHSDCNLNIDGDKELSDLAYNNDYKPNPDQRLNALLEHFKESSEGLRKTGVTRKLLWEEYRDSNPGGYEYSQYCNHLKEYLRKTNPSYQINHKPGEYIQCDFAGKKLSYQHSNGGKIECEVFVAILPFSGLTFCKAVPIQRIPDFVICIISMLKYFGGVTLSILVDNLKTAVKRASKTEPVFTDMCYQLADHYQTTFSATRPAKPRDKGMAERTVNLIYQNVYAPLRNRTFYSIEELNNAIMKQLKVLNNKPYKGSSQSRMDIFLAHESSTLKPLPDSSFELLNVKNVIVQRNYYIQLQDNKHYYSVPYTFVGKKVKVYYNRLLVEVYYKYDRIAIHRGSSNDPYEKRRLLFMVLFNLRRQWSQGLPDKSSLPSVIFRNKTVQSGDQGRQFENLWQYFFALFDRLRRSLDLSFRLTPEGFASDEYPQPESLREALVNLLLCKPLHKMPKNGTPYRDKKAMRRSIYGIFIQTLRNLSCPIPDHPNCGKSGNFA